jgi:predicted phosphodiesterase
MRIALLSDIHANLPALEAVLAAIEARGDVELVHHLGDLVGYAPWPNETVDLLRERRLAGVAGNYDSTVALDYEHCGCKYENRLQAELSQRSFEWTKANVTEQTRRFLRQLPFRLDLRPDGGHTSKPQLVLVHATPTLNTLYWTEDRPDSFSIKMARAAGARRGDVLAFGHTHVPWHREVEGIHLINAGSVGRPKDGDWRACYAIVEMRSDQTVVEFARVEYDLERAVEGIRASELPDEFADQLESAGAVVVGDDA